MHQRSRMLRLRARRGALSTCSLRSCGNSSWTKQQDQENEAERDDRGRMRALWLRGLTLLGLGNVAEAKKLFEEAIPLAGNKGERLIEATTLVGLGKCLLLEGNYPDAETNLARGYNIIRGYFKDEGFSANRKNHVREVLGDLIEVSQKLDKPQAVERWLKELEQLSP